MNMDILKAVLAFAGGLGLFIYGMDVMADGLQKAAGDKTRKLLEALTKNRLMAVVAGALVTAIIQSSSAVTVMVVGFVNASLLSLSQAVGVIMGANIGTTMTAWIVSMGEWAAFLKPEMLAPGLLLTGVALHMFARSGRVKDVARILIGFGMLFTGLSSMAGAVKPYTNSPVFSNLFVQLGSNPVLALLAGAGVTAVIQSSSASMGILQTLAAAGAVNWGSAVFIALGQNIGTCVTAMLSAASADTSAKRAAMIHLEFNVIGALLFGLLAWFVFLANPALQLAHVNSTSLAIFHTAFNVAATVVLFPFASQLVKLSKVLVPGHNEVSENQLVLDPRFLQVPLAALNAVSRQEQRMADTCVRLIQETRSRLVDGQAQLDMAAEVKRVQEEALQVKKYLMKIDTDTLQSEEKKRLQKYLLAARDLHQIAQSCRDIEALGEEMPEEGRHQEYWVEQINTLSSLCEEALAKAMDHSVLDPQRVREEAQAAGERVLALEHRLLENEAGPQGSVSSRYWMFLEAADGYKNIALRCLRLCNENQWQPLAPALAL